MFRMMVSTRQIAGVVALRHLKNKQWLVFKHVDNYHRQLLLPLSQLIHHCPSNRMSTKSPNDSSSNARPELKGRFIDADPKLPPKTRLKNLVAVYGPTAVVLHIALSLSFLGITYVVVRYGFDVPAYLEKYAFTSESYMRIIASGGTFGLAYAIYKSLMPIRVLVTIFLTPVVARRLQSMNIIRKRPGT